MLPPATACLALTGPWVAPCLQVLPTGNLTRLTDRRPLPAVFPDTAAMLKEEGATYNWL